jgi:hypothetical protein
MDSLLQKIIEFTPRCIMQRSELTPRGKMQSLNLRQITLRLETKFEKI